MNDNESKFYERYMSYNMKKAIFISDPYDTGTRIRNIHNPDGILIKEEYKKVGINLHVPER